MRHTFVREMCIISRTYALAALALASGEMQSKKKNQHWRSTCVYSSSITCRKAGNAEHFYAVAYLYMFIFIFFIEIPTILMSAVMTKRSKVICSNARKAAYKVLHLSNRNQRKIQWRYFRQQLLKVFTYEIMTRALNRDFFLKIHPQRIDVL